MSEVTREVVNGWLKEMFGFTNSEIHAAVRKNLSESGITGLEAEKIVSDLKSYPDYQAIGD